ncbi:MAG: sigma-70 family RNA polymerase sigma factor [Armatimonadota bacterium]
MQWSSDNQIPGLIPEESDIALMRRVRDANDTEAFALLAARYRTPLKRFFAAILPDASQADDFAQETLLRLWLSRNRYEPSGKFSAYLFQIGRHYFLNQRVRQRACAAQESFSRTASGMEILQAAPRTQPEMVLLEQIAVQRLRRHITELPLLYRDVFTLSHFEDLKYVEIAARLGIPLGTVKSRMAEAVRRLRVSVAHEEQEP